MWPCRLIIERTSELILKDNDEMSPIYWKARIYLQNGNLNGAQHNKVTVGSVWHAAYCDMLYTDIACSVLDWIYTGFHCVLFVVSRIIYGQFIQYDAR